MRYIAKMLLVGGVATILCHATAPATVINVPGDQPTIQAGIDAAVDGDTVLVAPGTWTGNISFSGKTIAVIGAQGAQQTILRAANPNETLVTFSGGEASGTILQGFTITESNSTHTVIVNDGATPHIKGNEFHHNNLIRGETVIRCYSPTIVSHNLFHHNGSNSSVGLFHDANGSQVINNTFDANSRGFYHLGDGDLTVAKNNIVTNSWDDYGIYGTFGELDYNLVWNNVTNYSQGAAPGAHDLSADPHFVDTISGDYELRAFSPCIDAGDPNPWYNDPDGTRNDIGAKAFWRGYPAAWNLEISSEDAARVISHEPQIVWVYTDTATSVQYAYELEVGTDDEWTIAEMWTTGEVPSQQTAVTYAGQPLVDGVLYVIRLRVSNGDTWGDWAKRVFQMNSVADAPTARSPTEEIIQCASRLYLVVNNTEDLDGDALTYWFELYLDSTLTDLVYQDEDVQEGLSGDSTASGLVSNVTAGTDYWWRCRTTDGYEYSVWSPLVHFTPRGNSSLNVALESTAIQAAISGSCDGDTILLDAGIYTIYAPIDLLNRELTVLGAEPPESTVITGGSTVDNLLRIHGGQTAATYVSRLIFQDCISYDMVSIRYSSPVLEGNSYRSNSPTGRCIKVDGKWGAANSTIIHNEFLENTPVSQEVLFYEGGGGVDHVIQGNTFRGNSCQYAILTYRGSSAALIDSNMFLSNSAQEGAIVSVWSLGDVWMRYNTLHGNRVGDQFAAIHMRKASDAAISHNTVVGNVSNDLLTAGTGILIGDETRTTLTDNIIAMHYGGVGVSISPGAQITGFDHNNLWLNTGGDYIGGSPGAGTIFANPEFCDVISGDFSISETSPCFGTGSQGSDIGAHGVGCGEPGPYLPASLSLDVSPGEDSLRLTDHTPRIEWSYFSPSSALHVASEIEMFRELNPESVAIWNPPAIPSPATSIIYSGPSLHDGLHYIVKIRVQDNDTWSPWAQTRIRMNLLGEPDPQFPWLGRSVEDQSPEFRIGRPSSTQSGGLTYVIELSEDSVMTQIVENVAGIPEDPDGITEWTSEALERENQRYWWRCRAVDSLEVGPYSAEHDFWLDTVNEPPEAFSLVSPDPATVLDPRTPKFEWTSSSDPDPHAVVQYRLVVKNDSTGDASVVRDRNTLTWVVLSPHQDLEEETRYRWQVDAYDRRGDTLSSEEWTFQTIKICECPCQGDPDCDSAVTVIDVVLAVNIAFRGQNDGPTEYCPFTTLDVTCDGAVNVIDVVKFVNVAFRGGDAAVEFCDPCNQ